MSDDDGSVLLLTVFLAVVLMTLVAVVVDASAAFLARRNLASAADGAALAAAQSVDYDAYYAGAATDDLPLRDDVVASYVAAHFPGTTVADVHVDGTTVTVTLERHVALPLSPPGYDSGLDVTATATARLRSGR